MKPISVLVFFVLLQGCVLGTQMVTVPHATFKIEATSAIEKSVELEKIEQILKSKGFVQEENDWLSWQGILDEKELSYKKQEMRYQYNDFEVYFGETFGPKNTGFIRLNFYERSGRHFSKGGKILYEDLYNDFLSVGLVHLQETPHDIKMSQPVITPEMFNSRYPLPTLSERLVSVIAAVSGFLPYLLIIMLPGWFLIRKLTANMSMNTNHKKWIFVVLSTCALFPLPVPISMFGPVLLLPGILVLPFMFGLLAHYWIFASLSMAGTFVVTFIACKWLLKSKQ